jgi:hypothetical protein
VLSRGVAATEHGTSPPLSPHGAQILSPGGHGGTFAKCRENRDWAIYHACRVVLGGGRAAPGWLREQRADGQGRTGWRSGRERKTGGERNSAAGSRTHPVTKPALCRSVGAECVSLRVRSQRQLLSRAARQSNPFLRSTRTGRSTRQMGWSTATFVAAPPHATALILR